MYPYSHKQMPNGMSKHTQIHSREAENPQILALAQDAHFLSLLQIAVDETMQMAKRYHKLMTEAETQQPVFPLVQSMYLDEKKHARQLRDAMFLITGKPPEISEEEAVDFDTEALPMDKFMEETLLSELSSAAFHRNFLLLVPMGELRDIFFEIFSDKQEHTNILTYLLCKYCSSL